MSNGQLMVRSVHSSEARGVPDVLVAPKEKTDEQDGQHYNHETMGYCEDGAYLASVIPAEDQKEEKDAQDLYYEVLKLRFRTLRKRLQSTLPQLVLDPDVPTRWFSNDHKAYSFWRHVIRDRSPKPLQVARMDQDTVLKLLKLITKLSLKKKEEVLPKVGQWIWALLARLRELECLSSEEVSVVRELGKKAIWCLVAARMEGAEEGVLKVDGYEEDDEEVGEEEEDVGIIGTEENKLASGTLEILLDPGLGTTGGNQLAGPENKETSLEPDEDDLDEGEIKEEQEQEEEEDDDLAQTALAAARDRLLAQMVRDTEVISVEKQGQKEKSQSRATRATLDMIITIAGEFYGQKDLLEFRDIWDEGT
jgi:hypothetical protein